MTASVPGRSSPSRISMIRLRISVLFMRRAFLSRTVPLRKIYAKTVIWAPRAGGRAVPFVIQGCRTSGCKNGLLCDASRQWRFCNPDLLYIPIECAILSKIPTAIRRNVQGVILQRTPCTRNPSFRHPNGHNVVQGVTDKITPCTVF